MTTKEVYKQTLTPLGYKNKGNRFFKIQNSLFYTLSYRRENRYHTERYHMVNPLHIKYEREDIEDSINMVDFFEIGTSARFMPTGMIIGDPIDNDELNEYILNELINKTIPFMNSINSPFDYLYYMTKYICFDRKPDDISLLLSFCNEEQFELIREKEISGHVNSAWYAEVAKKYWEDYRNQWLKSNREETEKLRKLNEARNLQLLSELGYKWP